LAEDLVFAHRNLLPIVVIRPSQVTSAFSEPIEGWVEGMTSGIIGMVCGIMTGLLQTVYCSEDSMNRMTPVDFVVNATIVSAYKKSLVPAHEALFFNCTDSEENLISSRASVNIVVKYAHEFVPEKSLLMYPNCTTTSNFNWHILRLYIFQLLPAYFYDLCFFLTGNKIL